jgi:hypothetical protein
MPKAGANNEHRVDHLGRERILFRSSIKQARLDYPRLRTQVSTPSFLTMALRKHKSFCTSEDVSAALIMASMNSRKRPENGFETPPSKKPATASTVSPTPKSTAESTDSNWVLKPAPYFYYTDRSREPDDDPLTLLTPPGLIPTFPAKVRSTITAST